MSGEGGMVQVWRDLGWLLLGGRGCMNGIHSKSGTRLRVAAAAWSKDV